MTSTGLTEPTEQDMRDALEGVLALQLQRLLASRAAGHCMRVTELEADLAAKLVRRLRGRVEPGTEVCLLAADDGEHSDATVSSTKLVELRNRTEQHGAPPGPLLVFVPPGLRAGAEDSFGIATFEEVSVADAYERLTRRLLDEAPPPLRTGIETLFALLDERGDRYGTEARARAEYLLTLQRNEFGDQAAGAALYHFGLVPDFDLFADVSGLRQRAQRNLDTVGKLAASGRSARQRVLDLGLVDRDFASRLAEFAHRHGMDDPPAWTRRIAVDREYWLLAFGNWRFDDRRRATLQIEVAEPDLPRAGDSAEDLSRYPVLASVSGQLYLLAGPQGVKQLTARFTVEPDPRDIEGLTHFRVEILAENGGPLGITGRVAVGSRRKREYKLALRKLNKTDWDEGWHYLRVTPLDDNGEPLDVEPGSDGRHGGESERFYAVPDAEAEEPPERSAGRYEGAAQALLDLRLRALADAGDPDRVCLATARWTGAARDRQRSLSARLTSAGVVDIRLSAPLVALQQDLLDHPEETGLRRLDLAADGTASSISRDPNGPVTSPTGLTDRALEDFIQARRACFARIRAGDEETRGESLVVEAADFTAVSSELVDYAESYADLVNAQALQVEDARDDQRGEEVARLARLLQIDCAAVTLTDGLGHRETVLLISPTHPLRALWLAAWSALGANWCDRLAGRGQKFHQHQPFEVPISD